MADTADSKSAPGHRVGVQVPPGAFPRFRQRCSNGCGPLLWFLIVAFGYAIVPAALEIRWQAEQGYEAARTLVRHGLTLSTMLSLLLAASRLPTCRLWGAIAAFAFSAYLLVLWGLLGYWWWTGHQFDFAYALDVGGDAWATLLRTFGWRVPLTVGVACLTMVLGSWIWLRGQAWLHGQNWRFFPSGTLLLPLSLQLVTLYLARGERPLVWSEVSAVWERARGHTLGAPIFPEWGELPALRSESVFLLQLESGNALATSGSLVLDGRSYDGDYIPQLRAIQKEGVWFPFAWANSIQTNRALENLLCGIDNNAGQALSYTPHKIVRPCLPEVLRSSGYRTLMFVGFDDLSFMNYRNFARTLGFDEVWDSSLAGDRSSSDWGTDDCDFYRAVFDRLRAEPKPQRLFVYIGVSAHHYPFAGRARYAPIHPFALPQNFVEWFLNSWVEQDFCVGEFYRLFRQMGLRHAHLWITADHAWPIGLHGNTLNDTGWHNENFLVPLLYVPPEQRKAEFRIGETVSTRPGLSDVPATILDLLSDQPVGNSFAHLLRQRAAGEHYEDCHLLVQPYGRKTLVIVRGNEKIVYHMRDRVLEVYDLDKDPEERAAVQVRYDVAYEEARQTYFCKRHRPRRRYDSEESAAGAGGAQHGHSSRRYR